MEDKYCIEEYRAAKTEILSTIDFQFRIISIIVTATAAAFVYLFKQNLHQVVISACLLIPGIYSFFGVLWLDQVYRQRRLAAYIFEIESASNIFEVGDSKLINGWKHFVREKRLGKCINIPSRCYYFICLGLFFFFPIATVIFTYIYKADGIFNPEHELFRLVILGSLLYVVFLVFAIFYIISILSLSKSFSKKEHSISPSSPSSTPSLHSDVQVYAEKEEEELVASR